MSGNEPSPKEINGLKMATRESCHDDYLCLTAGCIFYATYENHMKFWQGNMMKLLFTMFFGHVSCEYINCGSLGCGAVRKRVPGPHTQLFGHEWLQAATSSASEISSA